MSRQEAEFSKWEVDDDFMFPVTAESGGNGDGLPGPADEERLSPDTIDTDNSPIVAEPETAQARSFGRRAAGNLLKTAGVVGVAALVMYWQERREKAAWELANTPVVAEKPPIRLPNAVRRQLSSVVRVEGYNEDRYSWQGSGVKISDNLALTSGSMILDDNGNSEACSVGLQGLHDQGLAVAAVPDEWAVHYEASSGSKNDDLSLLKMNADPYGSLDEFDKLPVSDVASTAPKRGSVVYLANFGSNAQGDKRYPNSVLAGIHDKYDTAEVNNYGRPAKYAGVVIGQQDSYMAVATGFQGYNSRNNGSYTKNTFKGAWGGPAFNENGEVVGIVRSWESAKQHTAGNIKKDFRTKLPLPDSQNVAVSWLQVVSKDIINKYNAELTQKPDC